LATAGLRKNVQFIICTLQVFGQVTISCVHHTEFKSTTQVNPARSTLPAMQNKYNQKLGRTHAHHIMHHPVIHVVTGCEPRKMEIKWLRHRERLRCFL